MGKAAVKNSAKGGTAKTQNRVVKNKAVKGGLARAKNNAVKSGTTQTQNRVAKSGTARVKSSVVKEGEVQTQNSVSKEGLGYKYPYIRHLTLTNFRNFGLFDEFFSSGTVLISGINGSGKTNILESISLLSAGRGMRSVRSSELVMFGCGSDSWVVSAELAHSSDLSVRLGVSGSSQESRKVVKIDGDLVKRQEQLSDYLKVAWLTPQMERLFSDGRGAWRKLIDKFVSDFDISHRERCLSYENLMRQRFKLLRDGGDGVWLSALESQMSGLAVAIIAGRQELVRRLNIVCGDGDKRFPYAELILSGQVESWMEEFSALSTEHLMQGMLRDRREQDSYSGTSSLGPNCSDVEVILHRHAGDRSDIGSLSSVYCSSGERRVLLLSLILAEARLIHAESGFAPLLLLDEACAYLDEERRYILFDIIGSYSGQCWMTTSNIGLYEGYLGCIKNLHLG